MRNQVILYGSMSHASFNQKNQFVLPNRRQHRQRPQNRTIANICFAIAAGLALTLVLTLTISRDARAAGLTLRPTNWADGCNAVSSGAHWNSPPTAGLYAASTGWGAQIGTGYASEGITAASLNTGTASEAQSTEFFFVSQSGQTCYNPATTRSVTVAYNWVVNWGGYFDGYCGAGGSYSYAFSIFIYTDIHTSTGWVGATHTAGQVWKVLTTGSGTCSTASVLVGTDLGYPSGSFGFPATFTGTVNHGTNYDFFTSIVVDLQDTGTASHDEAVTVLNTTAYLQSIACPAC